MKKKIFVEERRLKIIDFVKQNTRADVSELAKNLEVTEATIRRDLTILEGEGLIYRTHGGVIKRSDSPALWQATHTTEQHINHIEEKERIANFISQLINDNESIILDGGSSVLITATKLTDKMNLLIVTNSPSVSTAFLRSSNNRVILLGGELLRTSFATTGTITESELRNFRVDKAIIGATAILPEEGMFCSFPQEAEVKRLMICVAREVIVAADSSKMGNRAPCFFSDFCKVNKLVTDKNISPECLETLKKNGVEVFMV
jgi:DeoR/GlpR family transcriptional regulator of sugar metabolism